MNPSIHSQLNDIFRQLFADPNLNVSREMTAADVARWDSLTHVEMIAAVEAAFQIKFKLKEIMKMKNVGDLADLIQQHLAKN